MNIIDLLFNFLIFVFTITFNIISYLYRLTRESLLSESSSARLHRLVKEHSELVVQRENISIKIANVEASINNIKATLANNKNNTHTPPRDTLHKPYSDTVSLIPPNSLNSGHPRIRQTTIGKPHPLPYTPPRTPDEEQRNRIVAWVNKLRLQQHNYNGNSG